MSAEFNPNNLFAASPAQASPQADADDLMWELLSLYVDGEASSEESAQVEQMLRHDAEYARAYGFMQQTSSAVRAIVEVEPPAFLRDAILAKTSHRITLAQRLSAGVATLRTQLALPPVGRLALAGGSLAACALLAGVFTARPANNGTPAAAVVSATATPAPSVASLPAVPNTINKSHEPTTTHKLVAKVTTAPKTLASALPIKVDLGGIGTEPTIAPPLLTANRTAIIKAVTPATHGPVFKVKRDGEKFVGAKPTPKFMQPSTIPDGTGHDAAVDTQNVSPMMDASVQHRQVAMVDKPIRSDDDLDRDVVTNNGDTGSSTTPTPATADTDSSAKGRLVGKLQLSKLPPTARHLQTAADIQRIQEARNMSFTATVMDGVQRRDSDLPVISGKF